MKNTDKDLISRCKRAPDESQRVVITLKDELAIQRLQSSVLRESTSIPYQNNMVKGTFTGKEILELNDLAEVEAIDEDFDVSI